MTGRDQGRSADNDPRVRYRGGVSWLLRVLRIAGLAYGGWLALLFVGQRALIFPGQRIPAGEAPSDVEQVWLQTDAGKVEAWFLRGEGPGPRPLLVYAHGNGELIDYAPQMVEPYRRMGFHVLLPEYRGYGRSAGSPSEATLVADAQRFLEQTLERDDVDASQLVFHGRSLGGGVVSGLARHVAPKALILESTFSSLAPIARRYLAPTFLIRDPFDSADAIGALDVPILIIHGDRDAVVTYDHAPRLMSAAKNGRLETFEAGHNDLPHGDRYWTAIRETLEAAGVSTSTSAGAPVGEAP